MPALITELAQGVTDAINDAAIPNCPTAERMQVSRLSLATERQRLDIVAGTSRNYERANRSSFSDRPTVEAVIYRKTKAAHEATDRGDENAEVKELMVQAVIDAGPLAGYSLSAVNTEALPDEWAVEMGVVGGVIAFEFFKP